MFRLWFHCLLSLNCLLTFVIPTNLMGNERFEFNAIPSKSTIGAVNSKTTTTMSSATRNLLIQPNVTPYIVTPTSTVSHCVCLPQGSCFNSITMPPNDGSGQIDFRIVNNNKPTVQPINCDYNLELCCRAGPYQCGRHYPPPQGSIPAKEGQAEFGEYPWQVALLSNQGLYLGSGALISNRHVLTSAHKIYNMNIRSIKVRLGEWDAVDSKEPIPAEEIMIEKISIHPQFNKNNLQNDIAIITLAKTVSLTAKPTIGTVCLPNSGNSMFNAGQICYVSGWGKDDFGSKGTYQAIQREVGVPLISNAECQNALRRTRLGSNFYLHNTSFICAGGEIGKDACTGDGGSPLVCDYNGQMYVVGLVAWGIGCANGGTPGVYVNVASYIPWIQSLVRF